MQIDLNNITFRKLGKEGKSIGLSKIYLQASNDGIGLYRKYGFAEPDYPELELK